MNIEQAARYWKQRLSAGRSIYRVRVRKLLELAGAERRGWAITRRITEVLREQGLETEPEFSAAWIDGLVTVRLIGSTADTAEHSDSRSPSDQDVDPASFERSEEDPSVLGNLIEDNAEPVAEDLNISGDESSLIEVPTMTRDASGETIEQLDPVRRIGSLASANRGVVSVNMQDSLQAATTIMMFDGYSQLAIMQNERNVRGVISWESIAKRSMRSPEPMLVSDCQVPAQVIEADGTLFDALPTIEKHGYVLVRAKGKITGIVTASDLAVELRSLAYAFVIIGTIEGLVRKKLHPCIQEADLLLLEEHSKARREGDSSLMTFGENVRLLERDEVWNRLQMNVDKKNFIQRLHAVREVRNDVMHFNPDPLGPKQKRELEQMEDFLRQMFT